MAGLGLGIADFIFGKKYQFPQIPAPVEKCRSILMTARPASPHFDRCFSPGQNLDPAEAIARPLASAGPWLAPAGGNNFFCDSSRRKMQIL
jgi:hypothetical protein